MSYPLSEYSWKPPSANQILFSIDRIYASGVFWRVVSPPLLEDQSRIMSAIALMAEVLRATLPPRTDQSPPEGRYQRFFTTSAPPETKQDTLIMRHKRERRLYKEAAERFRKLPLALEPTVANFALVYNQLTASLEFWEDAKSWYGMPWWREPQLDFSWAPPPSGTPDRDLLPGWQFLVTPNHKRTVTFGEGEKDSSPEAPALTRVPRCPTARPRLSALRARLSRAKLITA